MRLSAAANGAERRKHCQKPQIVAEWCETRRGTGTYVTGDAERIAQLRIRMASDAAEKFLRDLEILGLSREDAVRLLNKKEETENA